VEDCVTISGFLLYLKNKEKSFLILFQMMVLFYFPVMNDCPFIYSLLKGKFRILKIIGAALLQGNKEVLCKIISNDGLFYFLS
jgi:hypothetical protein